MVGSLALLHLTRCGSHPQFTIVFKDYACMFDPFLTNTREALLLFVTSTEQTASVAASDDDRALLKRKLMDARSLARTIDSFVTLHNAFHLQVTSPYTQQ
jgi:hypothetical protein